MKRSSEAINIEAKREANGLQDPLWALYKDVGPSLDEILKAKPKSTGDGTTYQQWNPVKGWEVVNEIPRDSGSTRRHNRKVSKQRRESSK